MKNISVFYSPNLDEEEKKIIADAFNQNVDFYKLETKGIRAGAFDVEIVINIVTSVIAATLYDLIKNLFNRNRKNIINDNSRPKYTVLVFKKETRQVAISNVNSENKIQMSKISVDSIESSTVEEEYSEEKLSKYLRD